jgi:hypothetical protein
MSKQKDGGQAFPGIDIVCGDNALGCKGMSLRDWFAGQALTGIVYSLKSSGITERDIPKMATDCYFVADAMLKARGE